MVSQSRPVLYPSLAHLLAPDALARATAHPISPAPDAIRRVPIAGGLSSARLERLTPTLDPPPEHAAAGEAAFILKQLDPHSNWLMRASGDDTCREVELTQSPLWERLPPEVWAPVLACARLPGGAGALLMQDVSAALFSAARSYGPADPALAERIVDSLAALHAACWEAPELRTSAWLATPTDALLALAPLRLELALRGATPAATAEYAAQARARWTRLPELIEHDDATEIERLVADPARVLAAAAGAPATLAHGDPWLANLGESNGRLILLDWALCTAGPATYDSLWLANTWRALDPDVILARHRAALVLFGVAAVADDASWRLLCDLGWVRTTLMGLESLVEDVINPASPVPQPRALARLRFWCARAAAIARARDW